MSLALKLLCGTKQQVVKTANFVVANITRNYFLAASIFLL